MDKEYLVIAIMSVMTMVLWGLAIISHSATFVIFGFISIAIGVIIDLVIESIEWIDFNKERS